MSPEGGDDLADGMSVRSSCWSRRRLCKLPGWLEPTLARRICCAVASISSSYVKEPEVEWLLGGGINWRGGGETGMWLRIVGGTLKDKLEVVVVAGEVMAVEGGEDELVVTDGREGCSEVMLVVSYSDQVGIGLSVN